jgi:hypothetical protein
LTSNVHAIPPERARRDRVWNAVLRQRFAAAESLALVIYPWERLDLELMAIDAVVGFPPEASARLPRALMWMLAQFYGDIGGEAFDMLYPGLCRSIQADEWLAILASVPVTLDDSALGRLVAMGEAARRIISDETAEERAEFRQELIDAARGTKSLWADWIDGARQRQDGLALVDIAPGWFRVEDPLASTALKRVLARAR